MPAERTDLCAQDHIQYWSGGEFGDQRAAQLAQRRPGAAVTQLASFDQGMAKTVRPAERFTHHGGATAQHLRRSKAPRCSQIRPCPLEGLSKFQRLPLMQSETAPGLKCLTLHGRAKVSARQCQGAISLRNQGEPAQGDLNHRGIEVIAQQPVGHCHRPPISRTALGHTQMPDTKTSCVLQLAQRSAGLYQ